MKRIEWSAMDDTTRAQLLTRPTRSLAAGVKARVEEVMADVAARGDVALRVLTEHYDSVRLEAFEVDAAERAAAVAAVGPALRAAIEEAASRIDAFHRAGMPRAYALDTAPGVRCERVLRPISPVGLYVPAGSAPLPSTALMLAIPAQLAGCGEIVLCTPPRRDGSADPAVLVAATYAPNARIFKLGGAQAIAAMSLGTASVPRCEKLFGPGNAWVDEAKRQASERPDGPAIDMPAGPSEVLVIADGTQDPDWVAIDLLSQAEHDESAQALLVTPDAAFGRAVAAAVEARLATLPRRSIAAASWAANGAIITVRDLAEAAALSNRIAPEHLEILTEDPEAVAADCLHAGAIFLGPWTPEAVGDYVGGPNHVLPTARSARFSSGLNVLDFMKRTTLARMTPEALKAIGPAAETLAASEGLQAHGLSVRARLDRLNR